MLWLTGNHYQPDERAYERMEKAGNRLTALPDQLFHGLEGLQAKGTRQWQGKACASLRLF